MPPILIQLAPAPHPRDGRAITEQEVVASLTKQGLPARPERWPSVGNYIGGRGGGLEEIAHLAIALIVGTFAFRVTASFADALGKDIYQQFKRTIRGILSRKEDQLKRARLEVTFELPHGQWLFFWLDAKDLEKHLKKLGRMTIEINDDQPQVWFVVLEKRRFWFDRRRWRISAHPIHGDQPPSLPR